MPSMHKLMSLVAVALATSLIGCCHDTCDTCRDICTGCGPQGGYMGGGPAPCDGPVMGGPVMVPSGPVGAAPMPAPAPAPK